MTFGDYKLKKLEDIFGFCLANCSETELMVLERALIDAVRDVLSRRGILPEDEDEALKMALSGYQMA